jgi:uncharacterized repeat protein (TIGR01451 family)
MCIVAGTVLTVPNAIAVHDDGLFELDANAVESAASGEDWATARSGSPTAIDAVFVTDPFAQSTDDVYEGGGSKDDLDLTQWRWKSASPSPDKDDLEHAFAAAYSANDNLYLYFGADRYATNGSANVGFWFLQGGGAPQANGTFSGNHADGDVFVAGEFTNGGSTPRIVVYEWRGGALNKVGENDPAASGASCNAGDTICAVVNAADTGSPWPYTPKSGTANVMPAGAFFEGGVNLSALFGRALPCISGFIASTRTSFEPNSQLKDFASGSIDVCSKIVVEKQTLPDGDPATFAFSGEVAGTIADGGRLEKANLPPGTYTVAEADPGADWSLESVVCSDTNSTGNTATRTATFDMSPGETVKCVFTNERKATKSGTKFHDLDADGARDSGEPGLPGWTFFVDYDGDGTLDNGEPSATSGSDGAYAIGRIEPGSWTVREVAQAGWLCSTPSPCSHAETFGPGEAKTNNDFGNYRNATATGTKFHDLDADGVRDAGEPGLAGWTFYVDLNGNGAADAGEPSAVSGADGAFTIAEVRPGTSAVREVLQGGWVCSTPASCAASTAFVSGETASGLLFGNYRPASVSGVKYHDLDADGNRGTGEPGLAGWTFYVDYDGDGSPDSGEPSATSGADGSFSIPGVRPGSWTVREAAHPGWTCSFPGGCSHTVTLTSDESATGASFGNWAPATVAGTKFGDENGDGHRDAGEDGLAGWTFFVDYDGDGTLDPGEPSGVSGADGAYVITGVNPGDWMLREVAQPGWSCSTPTPCSYALALDSDQDESGRDFGNFSRGSVAGAKFEDANASGSRDPGEGGLGGWRIRVYPDGDGDGILDSSLTRVVAAATTAADGSYSIDLDPGTYVLCEVAQAGWTQSQPENMRCAVNTALAPGGRALTLTSGGVVNGQDFGNWAAATKSGTKFGDLDADGVRDAGEPGLSGWTFFVDYNGNSALDAGEPSTISGADGSYLLAGIKPGTWSVREVPQAGWTCSFPAPCAYEETFTSRTVLSGNDFGNYRDGSVGGVKFEDVDGDGVRDLLEPTLAAWPIRAYVDANGDGLLQPSETSIVASAATGPAGAYDLELAPGRYVLCEVAQAGWTQSKPANALCAAVAGVAPGGYSVTVTSGSSAAGSDFGNHRLGTAAGAKFDDANANAARDAGESNLGGWEIRAYVDANANGTLAASETTIAASATTAADGTYSLKLAPGAYVLCEVLRTGWTQSFPAANTRCAAIGGLAAAGHPVTVTSNGSTSGRDFGNFVPATPPPPPPPPPPTPPAPPAPKVVDLGITKTDLRDPVVVGETITYSVVVTNTGPGDATGVTVTDVLPVDKVSFGSASFAGSALAGDCSYAAPIVTCRIGGLRVGQSVTITINVVAQVAGTAFNEAIVVGNESEPVTANNRDTEETTIQGPFTPPPVCASLRLSTRTLTVGKRTVVVATARDQRGQRLRGVRVTVRGPGVAGSKRTGSRGTVSFVVRPRSPGIVSFSVPGRRTCARRVGVIGVFQPPLSG